MSVTSDRNQEQSALPQSAAVSTHRMWSRDSGLARKTNLLTTQDYQRLVVKLQKRLKDEESEVQAANANRDREVRRCRIQRKLINHLRQRIGCQEAELRDLVLAKKASLRPDLRDDEGRVSSLNGALMRISGVEGLADQQARAGLDSVRYQEFDDAEFLPVTELENNGWWRQLLAIVKLG